jgi:hypothetical protein
MLRTALVVLVSWSAMAHGDASKDALAPLLDDSVIWHYEVTNGSSATDQKPVADAPESYCKVKELMKVGKIQRANLWCKTDAKPKDPKSMSFGGMLGMALSQSIYLAFDADGVRRVFYGIDDEASVTEQSNESVAFPRTMKGKWVRDVTAKTGTEKGARSVVNVTETKMTVLGKSQVVWVSEAVYFDPHSTKPQVHEIGAYAPGVAPVLWCKTDPEGKKPLFWCLRLTKIDKKK